MRIEDREDWVDFKANVARYLNHKYHEPCSCKPKTLVMWIKDIDNVYNKIK
jgi:hypothetical protein